MRPSLSLLFGFPARSTNNKTNIMFEKLAGISKRAIEHDAKTGRIFIIPEALHDFDSAVSQDYALPNRPQNGYLSSFET